jgi:hypothetical protein
MSFSFSHLITLELHALGHKFLPLLGNSLSLVSCEKWMLYLCIGGRKASDFSWMLVLGNLVEYI